MNSKRMMTQGILNGVLALGAVATLVWWFLHDAGPGRPHGLEQDTLVDIESLRDLAPGNLEYSSEDLNSHAQLLYSYRQDLMRGAIFPLKDPVSGRSYTDSQLYKLAEPIEEATLMLMYCSYSTNSNEASLNQSGETAPPARSASLPSKESISSQVEWIALVSVLLNLVFGAGNAWLLVRKARAN